jgi:hypothetical protein
MKKHRIVLVENPPANRPPSVEDLLGGPEPQGQEAIAEAMDAAYTAGVLAAKRMATLVYLARERSWPENSHAWLSFIRERYGYNKAWAYRCHNAIAFLIAHAADHAKLYGCSIDNLAAFYQIPQRYLPRFFDLHAEDLDELSTKQVAEIVSKYKDDQADATEFPERECANPDCSERFRPKSDREKLCPKCRKRRRGGETLTTAKNLDKLREYDGAELDPMMEYNFAFLRLDRMLDSVQAQGIVPEPSLRKMRAGLAEALETGLEIIDRKLQEYELTNGTES